MKDFLTEILRCFCIIMLIALAFFLIFAGIPAMLLYVASKFGYLVAIAALLIIFCIILKLTNKLQ